MSSGLRRRNVAGSDSDSLGSESPVSLRNFDLYNKVQDDIVYRSKSGGAVTIVTTVIIVLLLFSELWEFFSVEIVDSITVDTRTKAKLKIMLDVAFPRLPCHVVSLDTVDSAGDSQVDVHGGLHKRDLDGRGSEISEDLGSQKVGCRVEGSVTVNKVNGNLHIAMGKSRVQGSHKVTHMVDQGRLGESYNTSHEIHSIRFGEDVPGVMSPLDGTSKVVKTGSYMFHYYIKLVPTTFVDRWGVKTYTNQYSVTDSARNVQVRAAELIGLPGIFLVYDFSPFMMTKTEKIKPWSYIFTSICAVAGGVFSIATLVELVISSLPGGCIPHSSLPPSMI